MKPFLCWLGLHRYRRAHREMNGRNFMGGICERCGLAYWLELPEDEPPKPRDHVEPSKPWPRA